MKAHGYHTVDTGGAWAWRALLLSLVITTAIFLLLPLSDLLGGRAEEREVRIVERVGPEAIKPEREPPATPQHASTAARKSPEKPHLPQARRSVSPMLIPASLALDIGSDTGDFSLNFALTPTTLGEELIFEVSEVDVVLQTELAISRSAAGIRTGRKNSRRREMEVVFAEESV